MGHEDIHLAANQLGRQLRESSVLPLRPAVLNDDGFPLHIAEVPKALPECLELRRVAGRGGSPEEAYAGNCCLLRPGHERRGEEGEANQECPRSTGHLVDRQPHPTPARRAGIRGPPCSSPQCSAPRPAALTGSTTGATWPSRSGMVSVQISWPAHEQAAGSASLSP